ncbi:tubulin delta chain-like [Porites lutea]|uniref:tubulin delta chain-like n=1 Tax=Porites lutea TaxID=51062 RepID=UPI003CC6361D
MSVVTLQLGQCGNQIGGELFDLLIEDATKLNSQFISKSIDRKVIQDYEEEVVERFFTRDKTGTLLNARAVMIDMESKVISQTLTEARKTGKWTYPTGQQFCQKRGSGNNWAHGFLEHGPKSADKVLEIVQKEVEKCDRFGGFLILLSLAGGTGSGVGAYVTGCLRDEFRHSFILNQVVWPYGTGEVIVQNYNAILTLSHLYKCSDGVIILENDKLQSICSRLMNLKHISFKDINKVISHKLASVLQPVKLFSPGQDAAYYKQAISVTNLLGDLIEQVCPHPEYKLMTLKNIPQMAEKSLAFSTYTWSGLLKHLRQMLIADASMEEGIDWEVKLPVPSNPDGADFHLRPGEPPRLREKFNKSIANLLVLRGVDVHKSDLTSFNDPRLHANWVPSSCASTIWCHPRPFNHYDKSVTLLSNSQTPVAPLNSVVQKAWNMFTSRAYVHQYLKYGMTEDRFVDSFAATEQIIRNYSSL